MSTGLLVSDLGEIRVWYSGSGRWAAGVWHASGLPIAAWDSLSSVLEAVGLVCGLVQDAVTYTRQEEERAVLTGVRARGKPAARARSGGGASRRGRGAPGGK